jgi:hypothetical protein
VTRVGADTALVAIVKSASVAPAGIKTVAGGLTRLVSPLTSRTVTPPGGAADCSVTVPVNVVPPTTFSALSSIPKSIGSTPSEFCSQPAPYAARSTPMIPFGGTGPVVTGLTNASVLPAGIVTVRTGTSACGMSLANVTSAPPAGAGWLSITLAIVELPP